MEEIERRLPQRDHGKRPETTGYQRWVWKETWPAVKHHVLTLFRASMEEGTLPRQWRHARIIPLKKPGREGLHRCKSLETNLASRNPRQADGIGRRTADLPRSRDLRSPSHNHFGARKQRSAEQALMLLQEQVYAAWRGRRILSLISFDVKGAYNGARKERPSRE